MTENLKFHPEIEKALETSGEDIGRVKDVELAREAALEVNSRPIADPEENFDEKEGHLNEIVHDDVKRKLAERVFVENAKYFAQKNAPVALSGDKQSIGEMARKGMAQYKLAQKDAKIVGEELDVLSRAVNRSRDERRYK